MKKSTPSGKKDLLTPIKTATKARARATKATLSSKLTKIRQVSLYTSFTKLLDSLSVFLFKALYLDRMNKTVLYVLKTVKKVLLYLGVYPHILLAVIVYIAQQCEVDLKLSLSFFMTSLFT